MKVKLWETPEGFWDSEFIAALLGGALFWLVLWLFIPGRTLSLQGLLTRHFLALVLEWPLLEELAFRGILQGQLYQFDWARAHWHGVTRANLITTVLFTAAHLWNHSVPWALAVFVPSLIFGYFRDRTLSVYPAIVLHIYYNLGYFLVTGI